MRFGKTLARAVYSPWKDKYIDYAKLKSLLREDEEDDGVAWTEDDENKFCDEIFNVQLEKVAKFQQERVDDLRKRLDAALEKLKELTQTDGDPPAPRENVDTAALRKLETELDDITNEVNQLKKYSGDNYTGFLKIVKKHDRKRGNTYRIRPMMQLSLAQRPFNSQEAYSPLLNKLSIMYFAIRQQVDGGGQQVPVDLDSQGELVNGERYTALKFWIHPDNLLEVKTLILRHLPSLIYSEQAAKELDGKDSPSVTSLYFDNNSFDVYSAKSEPQAEASSLRLRWYGQLNDGPEIFVEEKTTDTLNGSEDSKFTIKSKYVKPFLNGEYDMEKTVQKMERIGQSPEKIEGFKATVAKIQAFLQEKDLSPVLRANYVRTAFQRPGDDRVRISIDTDLAFIREDTLDQERPCRDPAEWHRLDIDDSGMTYPFKNINQSEVSRFPFAVLEIKMKEDGNRKRPSWIEDLMTSHLVHPSPRFSKFVHGVASLFEDYVNILPFWLSDLESDIRKDPQKAFEEEEQRRVQRADEAMAVGSLIGTRPGSYQPAQSSPVAKSHLADRLAAESHDHLGKSLNGRKAVAPGEEEGEASGDRQASGQQGYGTLSSVIPGFSMTRYSQAKRAQRALPEGVVEPKEWIKNAGDLKIEPKVWLANERTFLKWQHICVLQGALSVALYTAAGDNVIAQVMGIIYLIIAVFAGAWGYGMMRTRRAMIMERSGKDFDNMIGPIVISVALMVALILNFALQYRAALARGVDRNSTMVANTDELR